MKFAFILSTLVAAVLAQDFTINTPDSVLTCANHQISFVGGTAPFTMLVVTSVGAAPLETYQGIGCSPFTWFVTEAAGTSLILTLQDSAGQSKTTAPFTIQGTTVANCTAPTTTAAATCAAVTTATGGGAATSAAATTGAATSGAATTAAPHSSGTGSGSGSSASHSASATTSTGAGFSNNQVTIAGAIAGLAALGLAALA